MYIVLSIENTIIANATELNWFYNIRGMKEIVDSQQFSQLWYKENGKQFMQLSNFINKKVMQLRQPISEQTFSSVEISGKIYIPKDCLFSDIYSDLIRLNNPQHN